MSIYQHYRDDERPFLDQSLDWFEYVKNSYAYRLTDFLDPREQEIISQLANNDGEVTVEFAGGLQQAERKRAIILPPYFTPRLDDFELVFYELHYPVKFFTLEHRQILGALMSLGIKREKFGDININGQVVQMIVAKEVADFVLYNLTSIGKATVSLKSISQDQLLPPEDDWKSSSGTITSMRLDVILSELFNVSRMKAGTFIQRGRVKVNWKDVEQPAYECQISDTISLRGYGRGKIEAIEGQTRKGKWRIQYYIK